MFVAHLQQALNDDGKQHERQTIRPEQRAGAADLIVRAARRISASWMCCMRQPAARRRQPGALHRTRVPGRTHGGPLLPFSDERRQRGKRGGVERRCAALAREVRGQAGRVYHPRRRHVVQHRSFCCSGLAARTGWRLSPALPPSPPLPRGRKPRWPWSSSRWR